MRYRSVVCGLAVGIAMVAGGCRHEPSRSKRSQGAATNAMQAATPEKVLAQKVSKLDHGALPFIERLDAAGLLAYRKKTGITICGIAPIAVMLKALKLSGWKIGVRVLDYYTSGDRTGDWTNSVSYFSIAFFEKPGSKSVSPSRIAKVPGLDSNLVQKHVVRRMATGPGWYPKSPGPLRRMLDGFLGKVHPKALPGRLVAIISPHAGYSFSGPAAAFGYKLVKAMVNLKRVVLMGPSHYVGFWGISVPDKTDYATPFGLVSLDRAIMDNLLTHQGYHTVPRAHLREHSLEMQLPFLRLVQPHVRLVPMVVGRVSAGQLESLAKPLVPLLDRHTLFIASSDFTHRGPRYGYQPFAK
ncbi:MAG: AmmeMemoRadiSam system protein B [Deltaproteobacteria bacterium]|nr:AmmeMemoRadiSam system protein B [Deltaproteobacteria bacterium]